MWRVERLPSRKVIALRETDCFLGECDQTPISVGLSDTCVLSACTIALIDLRSY
jgi:hypothetical protein